MLGGFVEPLPQVGLAVRVDRTLDLLAFHHASISHELTSRIRAARYGDKGARVDKTLERL